MQTSYERRPAIWRDVDAETWNDWHWQQRNRLTRLEEFRSFLELSAEEVSAFRESSQRFRVAVTPHYASMIEAKPDGPLRQQAIPQAGELETFDFELEDPLGEEVNSPVPGLTHRYPDRALLYVSHNCPMYCRHCTRKRKVANPSTAASKTQISRALEHIRATPEIRDVIISGGDPLTLSDERLDEILSALRAIAHVEIIRVGTRNPVTLPQRITPELVKVLRAARPIYLHTHFNHPDELGPEATRSLEMLLDAGCVLGNQMVLLKGVNDDPETVMRLNRGLLKVGCRPYYMLQCDMAQGITHFRTPLAVGLAIKDNLRGRIGGMGVPQFVVDLPGGGGKIELTPDYVIEQTQHPLGREILFRNGQGRTFRFVDIDESVG